jgi:tubulin-specific chaperone A
VRLNQNSFRLSFSLVKEVAHYQSELASNQSKLEGMMSSSDDSYDIKLFRQVVDESVMMVPDAERRLAAALQDLEECAGRYSDIEENEWMNKANEILAEQGTRKQGDDDGAVTSVADLADGEAF